jgi:hypothetical protein
LSPELPFVARSDIDPSVVTKVPYNKFFLAWSRYYNPGPIQTQMFAVDGRQERQYAGLWADDAVLTFAASNPGRIFINSDEPDQWCITPADYAGIYHDFVESVRKVDPTARFSPAGFAEPNDYCCPLPAEEPCRQRQHGVGYADAFYNAYIARYGSPPPVAEWRFHDFGVAFPNGDMAGWWARIDKEASWSVAHGANMVVGGWGFHGWREPVPQFQEHMKQAMGLISNDPRINGAVYWSYEPWTESPRPLAYADLTLTPEGVTYANPFTDIPAALKVESTSSGRAKLRWTNTTEAWAAEVEFWVQSPGSSSFVYRNTERVAGPGAQQTSLIAFNNGETVRARVRYTSPVGQGEWSPFSNTVVVQSTTPTADQGRVDRKRPLFCFLQSC